MLPWLLVFSDWHQGVRSHISLADRVVDVLKEGIDVALRTGGQNRWPSTLGHRYLDTECLIFGASSSYLVGHSGAAPAPTAAAQGGRIAELHGREPAHPLTAQSLFAIKLIAFYVNVTCARSRLDA